MPNRRTRSLLQRGASAGGRPVAGRPWPRRVDGHIPMTGPIHAHIGAAASLKQRARCTGLVPRILVGVQYGPRGTTACRGRGGRMRAVALRGAIAGLALSVVAGGTAAAGSYTLGRDVTVSGKSGLTRCTAGAS